MYMKLPDYLEYARSNHDEDPIYLFDDKFNERANCKDLLEDYVVPPYFQVEIIKRKKNNFSRKIILLVLKMKDLPIDGSQ